MDSGMNGNLNRRLLKNLIARRSMAVLCFFSCSLVGVIGVGLFLRASPILLSKPLHQLLGSEMWAPLRGEFGFSAFIAGTLWVTLVALILAVPFSFLTAMYLCEYSPRWLRECAIPLIDLLAGIPSVIYGVWGMLVIVPLVGDVVAPFFGSYSSGYSILAGGIVLAVMIFPVIIHVSMEVFLSIPYELREASLSLGATKWQTLKFVVLRKGKSGMIAATVLGLSRAFGETMAVLMVVGNVAAVPRSVFDPGYPLPALIANNYGEMMSVPLYDSALMLAALILLGVVLVFNVLARGILIRVEKKSE
jgi:phosphate transport system permease protein